mgnify:CR=1 FL=1
MSELVAIDEKTYPLLRSATTATIATVLAKRGLWNQFVTGAKPLSTGKSMVGQAFTLRYIPARADVDHNLVFDNSKDPQRLAIEQVGPGDVLVIDARGNENAGTMGNILATRMVARGAVGIVTDGCFRDSPAIAQMDIAAYARSAHAATNKTVHHPADIQLPVGCGGVAIRASIRTLPATPIYHRRAIRPTTPPANAISCRSIWPRPAGSRPNGSPDSRPTASTARPVSA